MKLPLLADALVSLIATGCLGVYQVTKRVIDPYLSFKREGRGFRRRQQTTQNIRFLWENFSGLASGEFHIPRAQRSVRVHSGEDRRPNGERDERSSGRKKKKNKEDADADVDDEKKNDAFATKKNTIRRTSKYRSLFTPAGYAFAIWGFIFTSEFVFAVRSMFFTNTKDEQFAANATGYFALANVLQSVWCFTFREWTEKPRRHWINAFVLGVEALALWSSKERVFEVNGRFALAESGFVSVPIRTHFAWILCACGINANTVLAKSGRRRASRLCYRNRGSRDERWRVLFFLPRRRGDTFSFCVGALRHIQGWRISSSTAIRFDEFFFRRQKRQEEQRRGREKKYREAFQQNGGMYTVREANEAVYRHRAPVRNRQSTFRR